MKPFYQVREFETVRDIIDQSAEIYASRPAFEIKRGDEHFNITYKQYREDINALSTAAPGVEPGQPVGRDALPLHIALHLLKLTV